MYILFDRNFINSRVSDSARFFGCVGLVIKIYIILMTSELSLRQQCEISIFIIYFCFELLFFINNWAFFFESRSKRPILKKQKTKELMSVVDKHRCLLFIFITSSMVYNVLISSSNMFSSWLNWRSAEPFHSPIRLFIPMSWSNLNSIIKWIKVKTSNSWFKLERYSSFKLKSKIFSEPIMYFNGSVRIK